MTDILRDDHLADRVAESVRHALRLVGHAENGLEHVVEKEPEESAVS